MRKRRVCARPTPAARANTPVVHPRRKSRRPMAAGASLRCVTLADRLDVDEGAGGADRLRHSHRQEEGGAIAARRLGGDQVGAHVLDDVNAVVRKQSGMNRESYGGVLAWYHLDRPGISPD